MTEKIILLIGRTGGGKSTLANVLSGIENIAAESENSASKTREVQKISFKLEREDFQVRSYQIVDSIGIGDTR
jgi:ABC-type branched-subunit amino acid transport system ATPase component